MRRIGRLVNHTLEGSGPVEELKRVEAHLYATRALSLTKSGDVIQLPREVEKHFAFAMRHYEAAGLRPTRRDPVFSLELSKAGDFERYPLDPYLFSKFHHAVRPDTPWKRVVAKANSKNTFLQWCASLNVAFPETVFLDDATQYEPPKEGFRPCVVKIAVSASGEGVFKVYSAEELETCLQRLVGKGPIQIQELLPERTRDLSLQYAINQGQIQCLTATEQIVRGTEYLGSRSLDDPELFSFANPIAEAMGAAGMRGPFGFDIAVTPDGRTLMIECNPRYTGATYPTLVARELGATSWIAKTVAVKAKSLSDVSLDTAFTPDRGEGVLLINWGMIKKGGLGVMVIAANACRCEQILRDFETRNA